MKSRKEKEGNPLQFSEKRKERRVAMLKNVKGTGQLRENRREKCKVKNSTYSPNTKFMAFHIVLESKVSSISQLIFVETSKLGPLK